jgi:hypothetical protein
MITKSRNNAWFVSSLHADCAALTALGNPLASAGRFRFAHDFYGFLPVTASSPADRIDHAAHGLLLRGKPQFHVAFV